jgi:hypothetical protein
MDRYLLSFRVYCPEQLNAAKARKQVPVVARSHSARCQPDKAREITAAPFGASRSNFRCTPDSRLNSEIGKSEKCHNRRNGCFEQPARIAREVGVLEAYHAGSVRSARRAAPSSAQVRALASGSSC